MRITIVPHLLLLLPTPSTSTAQPAPTTQTRSLWTPPIYPCSPSLCPTTTHSCLSNPNHPQRTTDDTCQPCQGTQTYWPCDVPGLCYCWDTSDVKQIPPAPSTQDGAGLVLNNSQGNYIYQISTIDPCDLVTQQVFDRLAPQAKSPYTYTGFCEAVRLYNLDHPKEGIFNMGGEWNQRMELAAFFGNALHESDEFQAGREYLMCADHITQSSETYCKPCDASSFDWDTFTCRASLASEGRAFNSYCQSNLLPPDGCECDDVFEEEGVGMEGGGYVKADQVYFGRGSIQLSWNYNYIRASVALTGAPQTFCQRPDLVATKEEYAWGAGLFYWMENIKNDKTCHQSILLNSDFGETLDNINGGLECPADDHGWHGKAVQLRLNRYCRAAAALSLDRLQSLDGCMDMDKKMKQCIEEGNCIDCKPFEDKIGLVEGGPEANGFYGAKSVVSNSVEMESESSKENEDLHDESIDDSSGVEPVEEPDIIQTETSEGVSTITKEPTSKPTQPRTNKPTKLYIPKGPCSGEPCFIPPEIQNDPNNTLQFCRNANGICGAGSAYCNADSTWTDFCHDCDVDSPYGCPTFGCSDCHGESQICVGNLNSYNPISDDDCAACAEGQSYWPCDIQSAEGCWCYDTNLPRVEPAAPSGLELGSKSHSSTSSSIGIGVCGSIIDEQLFNTLAPNAADPFTYQGFCEAIDHYNKHHSEKIFRMGSYQERLSELAAFLGMASHETDGFVASREYLACGDNKMVDGKLYCKPCAPGDYNYDTHSCAASMLAGDQSYMNFCQPYTTPPDGCSCEYVKQVESTGPLEGLMRANDIYLGRGSIQLSHNFNYIRASASMTGHDDTFCSEPEMLASSEVYSWGVGIYLWMDQMSKDGITSHVSVLRDRDFGGALNIINGGKECPVEEDDLFYSMAIVNRLNHYCNAARVIGVPALGLGGCEGLHDVFSSCLADGSCPYCDPEYDHAIPTQPTPELESTLSTLPTETSASSDPTITALTSEATINRPSRTSRPTRSRRTPKPSSSSISTAPSALPKDNQANTNAASQFALTTPKVPSTSPIFSSIEEVEDIDIPERGSANQFASHDFASISQGGNSQENNNIEDQTTHADSFAVNTHSKESNSVVSELRRTKTPITTSPTNKPTIIRMPQLTTLSPVAKMTSAVFNRDTPSPVPLFTSTSTTTETQNEMADWGLTQLNDDEIYDSESSTNSPTDNAVNVQDIIFRPPPKSESSDMDEGGSSSDISAAASSSDQFSMDDVGTIMEMSASKDHDKNDKDNVEPEKEKDSMNDHYTITDVGSVAETDASKPQEESFLDVVKNHHSGKIVGQIWLRAEDEENVGLRGILVDLFECESESRIQGTRTSPAGYYMFDELDDGSYYVVVSSSITYEYTNESNSNVNSEGKSECIEVSSDEHLHTINAGLIKSSTSSIGVSSQDSNNILGSSVDHAKNDSDTEVEIVSDLSNDVSDNCRGQPCSNGECRSKYSFCGSGDEYCNESSQWIPECPTPIPTFQPSIAPITPQPTFDFDLNTQCNGEPCSDDTWCRSELGFCGSGDLYCNMESIWVPMCVTLEPTKSPSEETDISSAVLSESDSQMPSTVPNQSPMKNDSLGWSPYGLPTLETVPMKQEQNSPTASKHSSTMNELALAPTSDPDDDVNTRNDEKSSNQKSPFDSGWYDRYSYLDSIVVRSDCPSSFPRWKTMCLYSLIIVAFIY